MCGAFNQHLLSKLSNYFFPAHLKAVPDLSRATWKGFKQKGRKKTEKFRPYLFRAANGGRSLLDVCVCVSVKEEEEKEEEYSLTGYASVSVCACARACECLRLENWTTFRLVGRQGGTEGGN